MSCQIVNDDEVLLLASCYCEELYNPLRLTDKRMVIVVTVAKELLAENYRSYNFRYNETGSEPLVLSKWTKDGEVDVWLLRDYCVSLLNKYSIIEKLKLVNHYQYQACEDKDWNKSDAYRYTTLLLSKLIGQLPGYDAAPWGI